MDMTRERISFNFDPRDLLLSVCVDFSFARAAVACAIFERTSSFEPSSEAIVPRYLKLVPVRSFSPLTLISLWMQFALFVISLVFLALISILYYTLCRSCKNFLLGSLVLALLQQEHQCHRQTADW